MSYNYFNRHDPEAYKEHLAHWKWRFEANNADGIDFVSFPDAQGFTKVYTSYDSTASIYVEDGKIVKIETVDGGYEYVANYDDGTSEVLGSSDATSGVYVFTDHSTTTIESFPSFCINHSFSSEWTIDDEEHWHACQTEKCGAKRSCDDHEYVDGACTTCGYQGN